MYFNIKEPFDIAYEIGGKKEEFVHELQTFVRTNQYSCFHQKPIVTLILCNFVTL